MKQKSLSAVLPTAFCPNIAYLVAVKSYNEVKIEAFESFEKQTYRNRAYIAAANGLQPLIIPLKRNRLTKQQTNKMQISYAEPWNRKHWRAICSAYGKSPYFEYFESEIFTFFSRRYDLLLDLNNELLAYCCKVFSLPTAVSLTESFANPLQSKDSAQDDLRWAFNIQDQGRECEVYPPYMQCFSERYGFSQNLSFLDLLFSLGSAAKDYLSSIVYQ